MRWAFLLVAFPAALAAQRLDPIQWTATGSGNLVKLVSQAEPPWHLYSMTTPRPPIATTAKIDGVDNLEIFQPPPVRKFDPNFEAETETFEGETIFYVRGAIPQDAVIKVRFQACTDKQCLPPRTKEVAIAAGNAGEIPPGYLAVSAGGAGGAAASSAPEPAPVGSTAPAEDEGLRHFLLIAFGVGLAAIFTPCVFPMIPVTMSFFLGQSEGRSRGQQIFQAALFCTGIVVLFTLLGAALTAALGPFGIVQIGSNPWVNGFIALIFIALAFSMFGLFEIALPSGLLTRLNSASGSGGAAGTLLMGLTFSLTSFACVGPFMGVLLASSIQGQRLQPVLGMMAFASGLALPFFFLALFPSVLKRLPRSGEWMMRVKVVMGFVILAWALKYISNIDQVLQWNIITRERFLAAWIVLFALPGLYLLGLLAYEGVKRDQTLGIGRLLTGSAFLIFAVSLLPGMFGGKLGELDAFIPLPAEGTFQSGGGQERLSWMKNDLPGALAKARAEGRLVFVNFTGYACTNCHWMKANMFPRAEISQALGKFVLLELYTDGTDAASAQNQQYQESKFGTVAIPFYAIIDPDEKVVATFPGLTKNPEEYLAFLDGGSGGVTTSSIGIGAQLF